MEAKIKRTCLKEAVTNIRMACDRVKPNQRTPYFFLVGAGISFPPIPLASKLVEDFKKRATFYGKTAELTSQQAVEEYSHWNSEDKIKGFDQVTELADILSEKGLGDSALREKVATSLVSKGEALGELGRQAEAIAVYDEVAKRFAEAGEAALREQVSRALFNKGVALNKLGRREEALAAYDELIKRFAETAEPALREPVAKALVNRGVVLDKQGRNDEAIATFAEVVKRFGEATDLVLTNHVARALNGLGFASLCKAKQTWAAGDGASARTLLTKALEQIESALDRQPADHIIAGNLGYILFLLGKKDEARAVLTDALALGGEKLRQVELDDSSIHPLPQDEEFRELVRAIPAPATTG